MGGAVFPPCCLTWGQTMVEVMKIMVKWSEVKSLASPVRLFTTPTLYNPMDCSLPGSSFPGILQAGILEWVAISFSRRSSQPRDRTWVSCMQADTLPSELPSKDPMHVLLHSVPPALHQATTQPCLCWRPPDTQSKSRTVSCRVNAPLSWILVHKVLFVPSKSLFSSPV